jgi:DNA polymerase III delta prime subunit
MSTEQRSDAHDSLSDVAPLRRAIATGRVHSAYLLAGPGPVPAAAALDFVRALVCAGDPSRPCERCSSCRRSSGNREPIALDGSGKKGPLYRYVGDHPDLFWVGRGQEDTRVRIAQVRALQAALHLGSYEGGWRAAVIEDAEWLNAEAQNALLRLLEEPPPRTVLVLVAASSAGLLATLRSRCQRVRFPLPDPDPALSPNASDEARELLRRIEQIGGASLPDLLDWAEEYRGARADASRAVELLLETAGSWLRARVRAAAREGRAGPDLRAPLEAFALLRAARRSLVSRNANPQMVAERALLTLHQGLR